MPRDASRVRRLEQLAYDSELTVEAFTNPNWLPTKPWHDSAGFVPDQEQRHLLARLTAKFGLRPWPSSSRFTYLQEQFGGSLELPDEAKGLGNK